MSSGFSPCTKQRVTLYISNRQPYRSIYDNLCGKLNRVTSTKLSMCKKHRRLCYSNSFVQYYWKEVWNSVRSWGQKNLQGHFRKFLSLYRAARNDHFGLSNDNERAINK